VARSRHGDGSSLDFRESSSGFVHYRDCSTIEVVMVRRRFKCSKQYVSISASSALVFYIHE
jgi:hypothetical protein